MSMDATPEAREQRPELVFLVGPPRSGTTWLQTMLGHHPDIGTSQESHLFNHFLSNMIESWDHLKEFDDGRGGIGLPAYQTEEQFLGMLNSMVHEVLGNADEYRSNKVFLEKTPDHILNMPDILRVIPDARFVFMIRRPEDTIESMLSAGKSWGKNWAPDNIFKAISTYRYFIRSGNSNRTLIDNNRIVEIKYEDLKSSTAQELERVLEFLGLERDEALLNAMMEARGGLKKYGASAEKSGTTVVEPQGFARKIKGRLSWMEKMLVRLFLAKYSHRYGY